VESDEDRGSIPLASMFIGKTPPKKQPTENSPDNKFREIH